MGRGQEEELNIRGQLCLKAFISILFLPTSVTVLSLPRAKNTTGENVRALNLDLLHCTSNTRHGGEGVK